jgi:hypothetical protein
MRLPTVRFTLQGLMIGIAILAVLLAGGFSAVRWMTRPIPLPHYVDYTAISDEPMTIAASCVGDFAEGRSWHLSVNSVGEAQLTIPNFPETKHRKFVVPPQKLEELRNALEEERFFDLAGEYGQLVPDGSTKSITVTVGDRSNSVKLHFLMNWVHGDKAKLREPSRAVRILMMIRDWFDDPEAVDLRQYDRLILDAAKGQ